MKNLEPEPLVFTRPDRIVCDISWAKKRGVMLTTKTNKKMETLKDIFVPYEIAVQLKEIGFDEDCIAFFYEKCLVIEVDDNYSKYELLYIENGIKPFNYNGTVYVSAPTWEQVKKWFREKNYQSNIVFNFGSFYGFIEDTRKIEAFATDEDYATYEQAREQLILKLIEIYKNGK